MRLAGRRRRNRGTVHVRDLVGEVRASYSGRRGKVTVRILDALESTENIYVLFEGNAAALDLVGRLFIAQARTKVDCTYHIAPIGPGCGMFADDSTLGIYIHRLPCKHAKGYRMAKDRAHPIGRVLKKLEARHRFSSTRRRIELSRGHGNVKFSSLYRRAVRFWPSRIDASDGREVIFNEGAVGHYFPKLSEAASKADIRTEEASDLIQLMMWAIFQELHRAAESKLKERKKWIRVAELDKSAVARWLVENLTSRPAGWRRLAEEFLRANPELGPVARRSP